MPGVRGTSGGRDGEEKKMAPWAPRLMLMSGSLRQIAREFAHLCGKLNMTAAAATRLVRGPRCRAEPPLDLRCSSRLNHPPPGSPMPSRRPILLKLRLKVATRSARVIGPLTVSDQNQRRLSGPPRVW